MKSESIQSSLDREGDQFGPTIFQASSEAAPEQNLAEFIRLARDDITVFGEDLDWGSWRWRGVGMFVKLGCPKRLSDPGDWDLDPAFSNFAKAYIRYEMGINPQVSCSKKMAALRAIECALLGEKGAASPVVIDLGTFDRAAQLVREHFGKAGAYGVGQELMSLARFLSRNSLTNNDVGCWINTIAIPAESKMHILLGKEADAHRRARLPDMVAVNAIGTIFAKGFDLSNNACHADVYVTSVITMLMAQPGRIGEIEELTFDLEVEQLDLEGDLQYGFRYRSLKSKQASCIKWVPSDWAPLAREAVRRIFYITEGPRAFARYVEAQLEAKKKDPNAPQRFYRHPTCPQVADDESLSRHQAAAALGFTGTSAKEFLISRGLTSKAGTYTLDTLWPEVLRRLPPDFPYINGTKQKLLKYSDSLFCMHANQLKRGISPDPLSLWVPTNGTLKQLLSPSKKNILSIFERHGINDVNGDVPRANSHQFRHLLNTLGHEGSGETFIGNEAINFWSGRESTWQGATYNHVPAEQVAQRAAEVLSQINDGKGVIELKSAIEQGMSSSAQHWNIERPNPKSCADIEMHHRSAVLMTLWGGCEHDWLLEPCQFHQDCLNCKDHFCVKGSGKDDKDRVQRLRELLSKLIHQQSLAKAADEAGEYGAASYYSYQTTYRERIEQLISLLEHPAVDNGAVIKLANSTANSHLHRVLKQVALSLPEGGLVHKDFVIDLVSAYEQNRALSMYDATATCVPGQDDA